MMDNRDLKRNASGYYDETPYKAMTTGPKPGDVWVRQDGANMLVIAVNGYICNTLRMNDTPKDAASVEIKHGSRSWWVNVPYIGFIRAGDLVSYEFNVEDEQLMSIKTEIGEALGLYEDEEEAEEEVNGSEMTDKQAKAFDYDVLEGRCASLELELQQTLERAAKLEAYREMYENLLDKVIGRAG